MYHFLISMKGGCMLKLLELAINNPNVNTVCIDNVDYLIKSITVVDNANEIIKVGNKYINLQAVKEIQFKNNVSLLEIL